jgi:polygalacturonase
MRAHLIPLLAGFSLFTTPHLAGEVCNIRDFGAVGDGTTVNTRAIQKAIDACGDGGGGRVVVPRGVFLTGTLRLHSHIDLHLETGAVLRGSANLADYQLDGRVVGLVYSENVEDVSITGRGQIDGNGDVFMDLKAAKKIDTAGSQYTRQKERFREVREGLGDGPVVPLPRPFQMIIFSTCRNVTIEDVLITNSPFWTVHFADCDSVRVSRIRLFNNIMVPNGDGLDFTSCRNVIVSDCDIRVGDDAIVFTGYDQHFDLPGFKGIRHPSENVTVANCTLVSRSSGVRIGGLDQNTMRNYVFSNLTISDSNRGIGVFQRAEGSIEDVTFSNIVIHTRLHTGDWWGHGEPIHVSAVRVNQKGPIGRIKGLKFSHIVATGESGILVYGTKESVIEDVSFEDLDFRLSDSPLNPTSGGNLDFRPVLDRRLSLFAHDIPAFYAQHVKNLRLRDVSVEWGNVKEPYFTSAVEVTDYEDVVIDSLRGDASPASRDKAPVRLRNGKGDRVTNVRSARGR